VEDTGGLIDLDKLPVGDPTLSAKEIIGNESQERMGLVGQKDIDTLQKIADRERAPMYQVGDVTGDHRFTFESKNVLNQWILLWKTFEVLKVTELLIENIPI
jgi:phosphoribosylformylglycinamidine synthase